jgi:hypothetical protein
VGRWMCEAEEHRGLEQATKLRKLMFLGALS